MRKIFVGCWALTEPQSVKSMVQRVRTVILFFMYSALSLDTRHWSSFHLITLSALANTFGGIVRPICLAALRLMMNSNFFGCSTGRSAGFLPFSILSTYVAERRNKSLMLAP